MLQLGCDGGTNATSGVAPEWTRKLFDLAVAGADLKEVQGNRSLTVGTMHLRRMGDADGVE